MLALTIVSAIGLTSAWTTITFLPPPIDGDRCGLWLKSRYDLTANAWARAPLPPSSSIPSSRGAPSALFVLPAGDWDVVVQQQSSANTDELTVVAVDAASSLQLLHDVRMDAMGAAAVAVAAADDDCDLWRRCCDDDDDEDSDFRNRSVADGNSCSVCLGTSEKLSWLPPLGDKHGVGWITCNAIGKRLAESNTSSESNNAIRVWTCVGPYSIVCATKRFESVQ